jgi:hypothetical protein
VRTPSAVGFYARAYVRGRQAIFPYGDRFVVAPSPQLAFEMARRGLGRSKALTTWRTALLTPELRGLLRAYLRARGRGSRVPLFDMLNDLRKLDIIRQARHGVLRARQPFAVTTNLDITHAVLTLTSVRLPAESLPRHPSDAPALRDAAPLVVWDHSALGHQVVYARGAGRWLTATIGVGGVHRFDAIADIERHVPGAVVPALAAILGVARASEPPATSSVGVETTAATERVR